MKINASEFGSEFGSTTLVYGLSTSGRAYGRLCIAVCFACFFWVVAVQPAWAAEFTVTSELDGVDSNLADGICLNETVVAGGACTLRAAIQQANASAGPDTIHVPAGTYLLTLENPFNTAEDASVSGDLDITSNMIINGAGANLTFVEAKADLQDRVFHLVGEPAVAAINYLTVRGGNTTGLLGQRDGGGILNGGGLLSAFELAIVDNTSPTFGGGIMSIGTATTTLHRCTINGNKATGSNSQGGGVYIGQNHRTTTANCTISDNEAESRGAGVAVANNSHLAYILNTTIANNRLLDDSKEGGGIYIGNNTEVEVFSSLIADNTAMGDVANDCYGQFDILDFSLVEVPAPSNGCIMAGDGDSVSSLLGSADPLLGPLADNGGNLQTHALLVGSIAIDAGNQLEPGSGGRACYATDARGVLRPTGDYCDVGAYEAPAMIYMPKLAK